MMMRNARYLKLFALLCILLALYGCHQPNAAQQQAAEVQTLLAARQGGINGKDQLLYLSTVLPSDAVLMKEESNLIHAESLLDIKDFNLEAGAIAPAEGGGIKATLTQSYTLEGEKHRCEYTAVFKSENGKLYYCGPDFEVKENNLVKVYYSGDKGDLARQLLNAETTVLSSMKEQLGFMSAAMITIKLFNDKEVFFQSVKLDLPGWVGGWHEYGEAIKSFTGAYGADVSAYKPMLNHESTHRMVSELSNDNAAYWIQEGLASVFEATLDAPGQGYISHDEAIVEYTPFAQHKNIDLEKLGMGDGNAVMMYYSTSKAYAAFLLETYGWEKVHAALEYMKKFELIPVTGAEKIAETNARTNEALRAVFGFDSDAELQAAFDQWQESKRK